MKMKSGVEVGSCEGIGELSCVGMELWSGASGVGENKFWVWRVLGR